MRREEAEEGCCSLSGVLEAVGDEMPLTEGAEAEGGSEGVLGTDCLVLVLSVDEGLVKPATNMEA